MSPGTAYAGEVDGVTYTAALGESEGEGRDVWYPDQQQTELAPCQPACAQGYGPQFVV